MPRVFIKVSDNAPPTLEDRSLVGLYGLDEDREWKDDATSFIQTYDSKRWENYGFHREPIYLDEGRIILKDDDRYEREGRTFILEWVKRNPQFVNSIDFVIGAGDLMVFMRTPYEKKEPWSYSVVKYKERIYIKANDTKFFVEQRGSSSSFRQEARKFGEKFPRVLTQSHKLKYDDLFNANKEAYGVYHASLGKHQLLYDFSIKAVKNYIPETIKPENILDFKTTRCGRRIDGFKILKWWAQNYLTGTPELICGFLGDNGLIEYIKSFDVNQIPNLKEASRWEPHICLGFVNNLLTTIKEDIIKTPNVVYNVSWTPPGSSIEFSETNVELSYVIPSKYRN